MITPQDIREKTFEKAVFGGYDMSAVDTFLEQVAGDLTLMQKENATLKAKMKVLVDKVEEYRGNEDALRMAVVSAQKMGNLIESEAQEKADKLLRDAQAEADRLSGELALQIAGEERRLQESQAESVKFIDSMNQLCRHQLDFLEKVGEMDFVRKLRAEQAAAEIAAIPVGESAEIHETVKSIEETIAKVADQAASDVHPDFTPAVAEDTLPTKAYHIISDPADEVDIVKPFPADGAK
jgi:cell division initiation protein